MRTPVDITNKRFGKLVALHKTEATSEGKWKWMFQCDCGNKVEIVGTSVRKAYKPTESCGCLGKQYFHDLTGQTFNELTLVEHLGKNKYNNNIYKANCNCGGSITVEGSDAKTGKIKSCGPCLKSKNAHNKLPFGQSIVNNLFADYRSHAKTRNIDFQLSRDEFQSKIFANCHYCGVSPSKSKSNLSKWIEEQIEYNGIDRVDNEVGYITSNTVTSCYTCNQAKHRLPVKVFEEWVVTCYNHISNRLVTAQQKV